MLTTTRRFPRTIIALALACAVVACAPSVAGAEPKDVPPFVAEPAPLQDLRSPDTRDAAAGRGTWSVPDVTVVTLREPAPAVERGSIDWGDAGIGAGTAFGVIAAGLAGAIAIVRRRRGPRTAAAA